jgi:hypothetical protein
MVLRLAKGKKKTLKKLYEVKKKRGILSQRNDRITRKICASPGEDLNDGVARA